MCSKPFEKDVAVALAVAILLWKDATPGTTFPTVEELVKIELGRVVSHPIVLREYPWLRSRLGPLQTLLLAEPWDVDIPLLLEKYQGIFRTDEERKAVGASIRQSSFADPAFDMIRRNGRLPKAKAEDMIVMARDVAKVLGLPEDTHRDIEYGTRDQYTTIYSQLYPVRKSEEKSTS